MTQASFRDRGRFFAVPSDLLDLLDLVEGTYGIPESVKRRIRDESMRLIEPLFWPENDPPDPEDVVDDLVERGRRVPESQPDVVTPRDICVAYPGFVDLAMDLPQAGESLTQYSIRMQLDGRKLSEAGDTLWLFLMRELTDDCEAGEWEFRLDSAIRQLEQLRLTLLDRPT